MVLGEGPTEGINGNVVTAGKKFTINFSKASTTVCLSLHYNGDESYLYVNKTEICKCKVNDNISWYNFCVGNVSKDEQNEIF